MLHDISHLPPSVFIYFPSMHFLLADNDADDGDDGTMGAYNAGSPKAGTSPSKLLLKSFSCDARNFHNCWAQAFSPQDASTGPSSGDIMARVIVRLLVGFSLSDGKWK